MQSLLGSALISSVQALNIGVIEKECGARCMQVADVDETTSSMSLGCGDGPRLRRVSITGDTVDIIKRGLEGIYTKLEEFVIKCTVVLPDQLEM